VGIIKKLFGKSTKKDPNATLTEQFIRCPQCSTLYALFAHVVLETIGDVRCGTCENTFSALTNRSEPKNKISLPTEFEPHQARLLRIPVEIEPEKPPIETVEEPFYQEAETLFETTEEPYQATETTFQAEEESYQTTEAAEIAVPLTSMQILAIAPGDAMATAPIYTRKRKEKVPRTTWAYLLGALGVFLMISLITLLLWLNHDTLGQYTLTRPWAENMCQLLDCTLSPYRDPNQIVVQQHQLTPDPADPSRLELHALIENTSSYAQPLANLEIEINDLQGNPVKKLTFTPEEYAPAEAKSLLEPRQTLYIRLEFIQPTVDLFSYEIKFI
jgi:predicted Zn finger-like uncharacterized protein